MHNAFIIGKMLLFIMINENEDKKFCRQCHNYMSPRFGFYCFGGGGFK